MAALPAHAWTQLALFAAGEIAGEVTKLMPGVGIQPTIGIRHPPGQLAEQDGQQHGADRDHGQHEQRTDARPRQQAGIVNTPVPMMLPMTSPVAEVRPRARAFC